MVSIPTAPTKQLADIHRLPFRLGHIWTQNPSYFLHCVALLGTDHVKIIPRGGTRVRRSQSGFLPDSSWPRSLCSVPAFLHCGLRLMLEKNSENESVRNEKQRHYQSWKKECGSQLPRQ